MARAHHRSARLRRAALDVGSELLHRARARARQRRGRRAGERAALRGARLNPIHPALARLARAAQHQDFAELDETLHVALRKPAWLRPEHRVGDPSGYMRHLLYVDPGNRFVITAITWLPGQMSAVHGHQVWCVFGVAEGDLTEEQFDGELVLRRKVVVRAGEIAERDLHQKRVHRVSNRGIARVVSLHLYGVSADRLTTGINRIFK